MGCVSSSGNEYDETLYPLVRARALESTIRRSNSPHPPPSANNTHAMTAKSSTEVATRLPEPEGLVSGGPTMGDVAMSLEDFITFFSLPQRAKVICGYWEPADDVGGSDSSREFAADELIQLTQVVCPFVSLLMVAESGRTVGVSLSTRFQNVRFRVVSHRELTGSTKPRVFSGVAEMVEVWPHTVKALAGYRSSEGEADDRMFNNGDRLRLVRIACQSDGRRMLECKLLRGNMRLLQLPLAYRGNFAEVDDPKGYTLHDLVSIARVQRTLKIHRGGGGGSVTATDEAAVAAAARATVPGIPTDFDGFITLERPQLFAQIQRVQRIEGVESPESPTDPEKPFLVPIDCPIEIALREDTYQGCDFGALKLKEIVEKHASAMPFVVRVTDWKEETSVLQLHLVRPGHQLILIRLESRSTVLVRDKANNRQYMLPVDHKGIFVRLNAIREDCGLSPRRAPVDLKSLDDASFPFDVRFTNDDNPYSNLPDALLPVDTTLTFEAFVDEDRTAVVAKLADGIICKCFHLPIRTGLRLQFERRWPANGARQEPFVNHRMSEYDTFAEEVNARVYNKLMKLHSDYEWVAVEEKKPCPAAVKPLSKDQHPSNEQKTPQKWMKDFELSPDGYLKPYVQPQPPPVVRPRGPKEEIARKKSSTLDSSVSVARRRNVPPPPTALRESAPPVPSRATRISCLSIAGDAAGSRTSSLTRAKAPPPLPPLPPPPPPLPPPLVTPSELNDDDDSGSSGDSDAQSYSYIDVETLEDCVQYRHMAFPGTVATDGVSIPSDGNVSNFSAEQMLLFLREVQAPVSTINAWRQLRINGQDFAKMSDGSLEEFNIHSIVVQFFRDRSRMHVLLQL